MKRFIIVGFVFVLVAISLTGCGYTTIQVLHPNGSTTDIIVEDEYHFQDFQREEQGDKLTISINFIKK